MTGIDLPKIKTRLPGPCSKRLAHELSRYECPQITYLGGIYPIFWESALGSNVLDVDQNRFVDLTAAFAVANLGHNPPFLTRALREQSRHLIHGMGDIHPNSLKVMLAKRLSEITPGDLSQVIFSSTGSEAVESALKTAVMHTHRSGVIAFRGAYHGLSYGTLPVTSRSDFKKRFLNQIGNFVHFAPYPDSYRLGDKAEELSLSEVKRIIQASKGSKKIGAVIIEPLLGRGGVIVPPNSFMKNLRKLCHQKDILLIFDEVFTGFGRTGKLFSCEWSGVVPDILCLGKGMSGGFPISLCIGRKKVMASWGKSKGESIHTSTFIGNPLGSRMSLVCIDQLLSKGLAERSRVLGDWLRSELERRILPHKRVGEIRGRGLMIGIEMVKDKKTKTHDPNGAYHIIEEMTRRGFFLLSSGEAHNVISITPPLVITQKQLSAFLSALEGVLKKVS